MEERRILSEHLASYESDGRRSRARLQRDVRSVTSRRAVQECGRPLPGSRYVNVGHARSTVSGCLGGLRRCANAWLCPECSTKIAAARTSELEHAVETWSATGRDIVMVTLTLRHRATNPLSTLMAALTKGWDRATHGVAHSRLKAEIGVIGHVRAIELLHGRRGWHPHIHALFFIDGRMDDVVGWPDGPDTLIEPVRRKQLMDEFTSGMFRRWAAAATREGLDAPIRDRGGLDWRVIGSTAELPGYLTKQGVAPTVERAAVEVTQSADKKGRRGSRSQWDILARAAELRRVVYAHEADGARARMLLDELALLAHRGPRPDQWPPAQRRAYLVLSADQRRLVKELALWDEFERVTTGRAGLRWSNGVRPAIAALDGTFPEQALGDDEIVDDVLDDVVPIAKIPTEVYLALHDHLPEALAEIRIAAGLGNPWAAQCAVMLLCRDYGIPVIAVPLPDPPDDDVFELPEYVEPTRGLVPVPMGYDQWHHAIYE